jgi:translation initiation factor 2A
MALSQTQLQFSYRTQKAIALFNADPAYVDVPGFKRPEGNLRCSVYSPCGRYFAYAINEHVAVVDADSGSLVATLPVINAADLSFSPRGTYLSTWERPAKDENGDATKNFKIWRVNAGGGDGAERQPIDRFVQKNQSGWNFQYTSDEKFCARLVTNEVQLLESHDLGTVWGKLRVEGVSDFALAPGDTHSVAVFVPERKVRLLLAVENRLQSSNSHSHYIFNRVYPRRSRSSMFPSSPPPSPRRPSSRATRCS